MISGLEAVVLLLLAVFATERLFDAQIIEKPQETQDREMEESYGHF